MTISAEPIIYGLIFIGVLVLVEGLYLTVFGRSISLNNRVNRRLEMLDKNRQPRRGHGAAAQGDAAAPQGAQNSALLDPVGQGAEGRDRFTPKQLILLMIGVSILAFLGLSVSARPRACRCAASGLGGHGCRGCLHLDQHEGRQAHGSAGRAAARRHRTDGALAQGGSSVFLGNLRSSPSEVPDPLGTEFGSSRRRGRLWPRCG